MCNVDLPSGRLSQIELDFSIRGLIPLSLVRHYRSTNPWLGDLGYNWGHTWGVTLTRAPGGGLVFRGIDGRRIDVPMPAEEALQINQVEDLAIEYVPASAVPWESLRDRAHGGLLIVHPVAGVSWLFDRAAIEGRHPWLGLADRSGNLVAATSDAAGRPVQLRDAWRRTLELLRDANGLLVEVILVDELSPESRHSLVRFEYDRSLDLVAAHDAAGTRTYEYDREHRLVRHTDRCGGSCTSEFDSVGRCVRTSGPEGVRERRFSYDPEQQTTAVSDSLGAVSRYLYQDPVRVKMTVDEAGLCSHFEYDDQGRLLKMLDQMENATVFGYQPTGQPAGKVGPSGAATVIELDTHGEVARIISPTGAVKEYQRDPLGRVIAVSQTGRGKCQLQYTPQGEIAEVLTRFGKKITVERSPDGRAVVETDDLGPLTTQRLDLFGRLMSSRNAAGELTRYEYDRAGRLSQVTNPDQSTRCYAYDAEGRLTFVRDETGSSVEYRYDLAGRRIAATLPNGQTVRCQYDSEDRLTAVAAADGLWHRYEYDARGLVIRQHFIDGRVEEYQYDPRGLLILLQGSGGVSIAAERDPAGHLTRLQYSDGLIKQIALDDAGSWLSVDASGEMLEREVSPALEVTFERQNDFWLRREFGEAGQVLTVTDRDGRRQEMTYDEDGRVAVLRLTQGRWRDDAWEALSTPRQHQFEYNRLGKLVRWIMPGDKVEERTYDARGRMTIQRVSRQTQEILCREYEYDALGRVNLCRDSRRGRLHLTYGPLGELLSSQRDGEPVREFHWDANGDLLQDHWDYAPGHRLRSFPPGSYEYDERGFVVRRRGAGNSQILRYSDTGLLRSIQDAGGSSVEYSYDAHSRLLCRRTASQTTRFFWNDDALWGYRSDSGSGWWFPALPGSFVPLEQAGGDQTYTIHTDPLGRVLELVDEFGQVVWSNNTEVWGEDRQERSAGSGIECLLGMPGQIWDAEAGLYYNRHRMYDSQSAHYLTPDPIGIWSGWDAYRYVVDPINLQDPLGLKCRGKNDDPILYRSDSRPPSEICAKGFEPQNPAANLTLYQHVEGVPPGGSNWISTTHDRATADGWMGGQNTVYQVSNPGCGKEADCDPELMKKYGPDPAGSEHEIAFNKAIPPKNIMGWFSPSPGGGFTFNACP